MTAANGRIASGRRESLCTQCGAGRAANAPPSCTRCAFDRMTKDDGTLIDGVPEAVAVTRQGTRLRFARRLIEDLALAEEYLAKDRIKGGLFYVWVSLGDYALRPLHQADNAQGRYEHYSAPSAMAVAARMARELEGGSAWVLTRDGIWQVSPGWRPK